MRDNLKSRIRPIITLMWSGSIIVLIVLLQSSPLGNRFDPLTNAVLGSPNGPTVVSSTKDSARSGSSRTDSSRVRFEIRPVHGRTPATLSAIDSVGEEALKDLDNTVLTDEEYAAQQHAFRIMASSKSASPVNPTIVIDRQLIKTSMLADSVQRRIVRERNAKARLDTRRRDSIQKAESSKHNAESSNR